MVLNINLKKLDFEFYYKINNSCNCQALSKSYKPY